MFRKALIGLLKAASLSIAALAFTGSSAMSEQLKLVSGSVGGGYYQAAAVLSEYVATEVPDLRITVMPGTTWANVDQLDSGAVDLAIIENITSTLAWKGESPTGQKYDFRMMAAVRGPSVVQAFIPSDRGVTSFEQIVQEKRPIRIATFERSQAVTPIALDVLAAYGITKEAVESWGGQLIFTSINEGFQMIGNGTADMWISGGSYYPHPSAIELGVKGPFLLLPLNQKVADSVAQKYGMTVGTVPANAYGDNNGKNEAYPSPVLILAFAARTGLSDDTVYKIMDALWKHRDEFRAVHEQHKVYDLPFAAKNVGEAPLHPGAAAWYAEHGVK
ncbi:MAG: TAXI family TRAP transporter solute-binding subunit [Parvibaculaceae bacterium]